MCGFYLAPFKHRKTRTLQNTHDKDGERTEKKIHKEVIREIADKIAKETTIKNTIATAKRLLELGSVTIADIVKVVSLPVEEVEKLNKSNGVEPA